MKLYLKEDTVKSLQSIGFSDFFRSNLPEGAVPARIAAVFGDRFLIWHEKGEFQAIRSGRLSKESFGAGDFVWLNSEPTGEPALIEGLLPRKTVFTRANAGKATGEQVIGANVDVVFVVTDVDRDFNLRRLERYLVAIQAGGAQAQILLNKQDLCADPWSLIAKVERRCPGVEVHLLSALDNIGLEIIESLGEGTTAALVGSSGVGKSTIVKRLINNTDIATKEIAQDGRGRHTTTHRQLYMLDCGVILLDTPGMREFSLLGQEGIDQVFDDIIELACQCRYRDCQHIGEEGCAVEEAVKKGVLDRDRLDHFLKLQIEARSFERRQDEKIRRQYDKKFGQMVNEVKKQIRKKRGIWG